MTGSCLSWIRKRPMDKMFLQCSLVETRIRICSVVVMTREIQGHLVCMTHIVCIFNWQHPMLNSYCESMSAPGKHFVIMNPGTVKSFMGQNNSIPLLNTTQSIRSVKTDVSLTQRFPVEAASNMHAFMMRHTTLHLLNLQVAEVSCGGNMCDALMMYENGISADKCACYSLAEREAKICLVLDVKILYKGSDGGKKSFCVYNHTSKQFTRLCMFDFKIPVGVIPDNITSDLQNMTSLQEAVDNILDLGNKDGGWNISGWTKRGTSADAGLEQSATSYKPVIKQTVDAGKLGYHLTSIGFNRRQDLSVLDNIQFNAINLFKIYN